MDDNSWLMGFFEGQTSFSVNIGLTKTKNKRYVILKPYVTIANADQHQIDFIMKHLNLTSKIIKKKKKEEFHNECYTLNIQKFDDIDKILSKLVEYRFKSRLKQEKLLRFVECYVAVKKLGYIHTKWNDGFVDIIDKKLKINQKRSNVDKNRFGKDVWIKKIEEHLNSVE
jgi:hypothetical protein